MSEILRNKFEAWLILRKHNIHEFAIKREEDNLFGIPISILKLRDEGDYASILNSPTTTFEPTTPEQHLFYASCCLDFFTQLNWTGPIPSSYISSSSSSSDSSSTDSANSANDNSTTEKHILAIDGETPYARILSPELLNSARQHLRHSSTLSTCEWWLARTSFAHQRVMQNPCESLKSACSEGYGDAIKRFGPNDDETELSRQLALTAYLERGLMNLYYRDIPSAVRDVERARELCGLRVELKGALGKRTKFQEKPTSQLYLDIVKQWRAPDPRTFAGFRLPSPATYEEDSDLAECVIFSEARDACLMAPEEQAIVLALCALRAARAPSGERIYTEENLAYANRVLLNPADWSVHCAALLTRSRLEKGLTKALHRSLTQLEDLCAFPANSGAKKSEVSGIPAWARVAGSHLVLAPPVSELKRELGQRYVEIGMPSFALKIYEEMGMTEEMVLCYAAAGQQKEAEALARSNLEKAPTPEMLCVLAEVTGDKEPYEQAWELSKHKFPMAKRQLGHWYFKRKMYAEAITHYKQALAINYLFDRCWFAMGCAAMQIEDWDTALTAFSRVVSIEPDDGEAWCNIAAVHMHNNRPQEAHVSLREALRQKPDSWKIWQNYVLVSAAPQVRDYQSAVFGLGRLVDLYQAADKSKTDMPASPDPRPIFMIASAIAAAVGSTGGSKSEKGVGAVAGQFGDVLVRIENEMEMNPPLYDLFAFFAETMGDYELAVERRKAQCRLLEGSWPGDKKRWLGVAEAYTALAEDAVKIGDKGVLDKLRSVLDRAAPFFNGTNEFNQLVSLVRKIESL